MDVKREILELIAASAEAKAVAQKLLSLTPEHLEEVRQIIFSESQDEPTMEEAEERNNPGAGFGT